MCMVAAKELAAGGGGGWRVLKHVLAVACRWDGRRGEAALQKLWVGGEIQEEP